jgi:hypothetical protein
MADAENLVQFSLPDQLKIEGINCKGFGVLPKYVMLDQDLTIDAKTIYAYFCSFAGNGTSTFPSRDRILSDLSMNKNAYYKHFKLLTDQGYLTVEQEHHKGGRGDGFARNVYTLVSNPKKFSEQPEDNKDNITYSRIRFSGLKAAGFGMIPKAVMIDDRLPVKAKGIYAYFCSFTGSGNTAFPKVEIITYHLGITRNTYYKFYRVLTELNYITAVQRHIDGRMAVNDYCLTDNPVADKNRSEGVLEANKQDTKIQDTQIPCTKIQDTQKQDTQIPCTKIQDTQKQDTKIQDTQNRDTNINSINKNKSYYKQSINQQTPAEPEAVIDGLMEEELKDIVYDELWDNKKLPLWYQSDYQRMAAAVHLMTSWETLYPQSFSDDFSKAAFVLFNEALIDMGTSTTPIKLKGVAVSGDKIIDKINQYAVFAESGYIDISSFMDTAIFDYSTAVKEREIKNHLRYMQACIWNALQTGNVAIFAQVVRDLG